MLCVDGVDWSLFRRPFQLQPMSHACFIQVVCGRFRALRRIDCPVVGKSTSRAPGVVAVTCV